MTATTLFHIKRESIFVHGTSGIVDFIKVYLDFRNTSCVLTEFGSYAARNMFP